MNEPFSFKSSHAAEFQASSYCDFKVKDTAAAEPAAFFRVASLPVIYVKIPRHPDFRSWGITFAVAASGSAHSTVSFAGL